MVFLKGWKRRDSSNILVTTILLGKLANDNAVCDKMIQVWGSYLQAPRIVLLGGRDDPLNLMRVPNKDLASGVDKCHNGSYWNKHV
jgi:hypothetical protein